MTHAHLWFASSTIYFKPNKPKKDTWLWVKNACLKWNPGIWETRTKTSGPIPGGFILTHAYLWFASSTIYFKPNKPKKDTWLWVKNACLKWKPGIWETRTKTSGPIPGGFILTHAHLWFASSTSYFKPNKPKKDTYD